MDQINYFLLFFLYTGAFCLAVAVGITFLLSKRIYGTFEKLQKLFGVFLLLIAIHLFVQNYTSFIGEVADVILLYLLAILDLSALIYTVVFISRSLHRTDDNSGKIADMGMENNVNGTVDNKSGKKSKSEEDVAVPIALENEELEEIEDSDVEKFDDEGDAVEQLENPNVDDFLFFQKVEALMVNEMLFCEQELSREDLAAAIGTNRTYLARSIKSATGKTFSGYITDLRTAYAAKLLITTEEPLDLIGSLVGFRSKSAYYRAFSAAYNCSPSEYRKNSVCLRTLEKEEGSI